MSFKFELSNVKDSLTQLYHYVAAKAKEEAWKGEPIISDSSVSTRIRLPNPNASEKDIKANSEPFSTIEISLAKPYAPQLGFEIAYTGKKALARFNDLLHDRNKNICNAFFAMIQKLDGFTVKLQVRTTFKNNSFIKSEDVFVAPSGSVSVDDVVQNLTKAIEVSSISEIAEDGKVAKYRGPCIAVCRDFSLDDLAQENSLFDDTIKTLHEFMLSEPKILSEKEAEKAAKGKIKERTKVKGTTTFHTILSNRVNKQFFCRLSKSEFDRVHENIGVQVWDTESFEEKKYIRAALKLVSEI